MKDLDAACKELAQSIDGAILCGIIDVTTGQVLALHATEGVAADFEGAFKDCSRELFRNPTQELDGAASVWSPNPQRFAEVQLVSARTCYLAKALADGSRALVVVAHKDTNVGLGWAELRETASELTRAE